MKKKILLSFIIVCMSIFAICALNVSAATSGICGDNVYWELDNEGTLKIFGTGPMYDYECSYLSQCAPWDPFYSGNKSIKNIIIENGVTTIGNDAFYNCDNLTMVSISNSVTKIGHQAFSSCPSLTNILIPESVTDLGDGAFNGCGSLETIYIPNKITRIGNGTFETCGSLTSIVIPDSVISIGEYAFSNCNALCEVTIGNALETIEHAAFSSCTNLCEITIPNSTTKIGSGAFGGCTNLETLTLGDSLISIEEYAFYNCEELKEVTLGESVITVEKYAFANCIGLKNVILGRNITYIGDNAFEGCRELTKMIIPNSVEVINPYTFQNCESLEEVVIGDNIIKIGESSFAYCENLKKINIPNGVIEIGANSFCYCSLISINIPNSTKIIGSHAFYECSHLSEVSFGDSIETIGDSAFYNTNLTEIILPQSLVKIGFSCFAKCNNLTTVMISKNVESISETSFAECTSLTSICVSEENNCYSSIDGNLYDKNQEKLYQYAIGKKENSFVIPNNVKTIGNYAFYKGVNLSYVTISNSITSIGDYAFCDCENLLNISISEKVTNIGLGAFYRCTQLNNVYWNTNNILECPGWRDDNTPIFRQSGNGEMQVVFGDSVETIPSYIFYKCSGLKKIIIGKNVKTIGLMAFDTCSNLTEVVIGNKVESIYFQAFARCPSIQNIIIPDNVISISNSAFANCRGLREITIGYGLKNIGMNAFYECSNLSDVYYSGNEDEWNSIEISSYNNGNDFLLDARIHYNQELPKGVETIGGKFNFASGVGQADYYYEDNFFEGISHNYNHELSKMSMRLALSAFASNNGSVKYQNAEQLLTDLNFNNIDYNYAYTVEPDTDSIGVIVGKKHIAYTDDYYTLLAVAIRGGGYKDEWYGNFRVGNENIHEGFNLAKGQVVDFLTNYIKEKEITGKVKIWITGYSRAGATANLTAAYLNENPNCLSDSVTLTTDNIYAYCFEPPAGVKNPDNQSGLYNNIFNIVNQHDFVPMVAMKKWGFDRYGITKYLPSAYTNKDYTTLKSNMSTKFKEYAGENYAVDNFTYYTIYSDKNAVINKGTYNQGVYLERIIDKLADNIGSTKNYENEFQAIFCEYIGQDILGSGNIQPLCDSLKQELTDSTLIALLSDSFLALNPSFTWIGQQTAYWTLRKAVKDAFENVGTEISNYAVDTIVKLILDIGVEGVYNLLENANGIKQSHYPELCMAWLDTIDENDFTNKRLRTLYLNCPVDLEIYDSNNNLVAAIYDDVPQSIDGSSIFPFIDENGQKVVYLPQDEEYRIEVIATDDGEVTYTVQEEDLSTNSVKVINYNNMVVSKSDILTGIAENLTTTDAVYSLLSNTAEVKEAEIIENAEPISVTTSVEGNGYAVGDNLFYKGEYAQLTATPTDSEEFIGWFNGETLISEDMSYRFQVTKPVNLTAKFTTNTCEIMFMDNENVISSVRIIKGETVEYPQAPDKDGYTFNGYYTEKEFLYLANEGATYSEDTKLYAKYDEIIYEDYIQYYVKDDFAYIYKYTADAPSVRIPVSIDGYPVSTICNNAFECATSLWNILIPDTVSIIEENAFAECENLQEVYYIGTGEQWEQIKIANGNDTLIQATKTYNYCDDIVSIQNYGFGHEEGNILIDLNFGYVYKDCFAYIDIFDAETKAKKTGFTQAIEKMTDNIEMSFPFTADDNQYIVRVSIVNSETDNKKLCSSVEGYIYTAKPRYMADDFEFVLNDNGEAEIESYYGDETDLIIPKTLDEYAVTGLYKFGLCGANISSVYIGKHITKIGDGSLSYCYNLNNITVAENNPNYCSVDGMLYSKDKTIFMQYLISKEDSNFEIPEGVKVIGAHAFESAENIKTIKLPETLERIERQGLACGIEGDLTLPESVKYIGKEAFANSKISSITIPSSTTEIAAAAFSMMPNLIAINVDENNVGYVSENGVLFKTDNGSLVKRKIGLIAYPVAKSEKLYAVPDGVYSIYPSAFGENKLISIILPTSLRVIGEQAFVESINLKTVCYKGSENQYSLLQIQNYNDWLLMADVVFNYDGNPNIISGAYAEFCDKTIFANVEFSLLTQDGTLFVAVYDKDGRLVSLDKKEVGSDEISYDFEFEIESFSNDYTIKTFCWESGNTLKPLSVPFTTNIQEVIITDAVLESEHPYTDNCDDTQVFEYDGDCTSLSIRFTEDCELEEGFDYVYIYDSNDECQCFTGTELANKTVIVNGNSVKIQLVADGSVSGYGYKTKRIVAIK